MLRCSRCEKVFPAPVTKAKPRPARAPERESLSFAFDDEDDWTANAPPGSAERGELRPQGIGGHRLGETIDFSEDEDLLDGMDIPDDEFPDDEEDDTRRGGVRLRIVFLFLVLVITAYALFARTLYANPGWAIELMASVPLIGDDLRERKLDREVTLIELHGHHERTKDGTLVFLITGKALNESGSRLRNVQVAATLFDGAGTPVDRRVTFCGSTVRTDLINNLSVSQVEILGGLKPPQRFAIQPGEKCPFASIFIDAPATMASFAAEVANVQHQG